MKKSALTVFMVFIFVSIIVGHVFAQNYFPEGKWWKHPEILEKIDLTDEQIQKIEKISNETIRKIIDLEAKFKIARLDLENLIDQTDQEKLDLETLEKQIDLVNTVKGELEKERLMMLARIRNVLSKDTIKELKKLRGKFGKRFREKRRSSMGDNEFGKGSLNDEFERPRDF